MDKTLEWRTEFRGEHDFQAWCVERLRHLGFVVRVTSSNVRGHRQHRGMSDVLVRNPNWEQGVWKALEFKSPDGKGRLSPEQHESVLRKEVILVSHWQDLCAPLAIPQSEQLPLNAETVSVRD
jgi:hypothetical protein